MDGEENEDYEYAYSGDEGGEEGEDVEYSYSDGEGEQQAEVKQVRARVPRLRTHHGRRDVEANAFGSP